MATSPRKADARRLVPVVVLLAACTDRVVYQADVPMPDAHWDRSRTPEFWFLVKDTVRPHDVYIDVRHTSEKPPLTRTCTCSWTSGTRRAATCATPWTACWPTRPGGWLGKGTGFIHADRYEAHMLYRYRD